MIPTAFVCTNIFICLTKTTAAQNEDALSYHGVRGLHFMAVVFVRSMYLLKSKTSLWKIEALKAETNPKSCFIS